MGSTMLSTFVNAVCLFFALILVSHLIDRMWVSSLPGPAYLIFAAPGIMFHEISHVAACLLTGTKVEKVVLISRSGGSVTHGQPRLGFMGTTVISMAPSIGIPLTLLLAGVIFDRAAGCEILWGSPVGGTIGDVVLGTLRAGWDLLWRNLVVLKEPWFVLFLYLAASLTTALAPSKEDLKRGVLGLAIVAGLTILWIVFIDRVHLPWSFPVLRIAIGLLMRVIGIGFTATFISFLIGLPFLIVRTVSGT
jgi:hypothetical protein